MGLFYYVSRSPAPAPESLVLGAELLGPVVDYTVNGQQPRWLYRLEAEQALPVLDAYNANVVLVPGLIMDRAMLLDVNIAKKRLKYQYPNNLYRLFHGSELIDNYLVYETPDNISLGLVSRRGLDAAIVEQVVQARFGRGEFSLDNGRGYGIDVFDIATSTDLAEAGVELEINEAQFICAEVAKRIAADKHMKVWLEGYCIYIGRKYPKT